MEVHTSSVVRAERRETLSFGAAPHGRGESEQAVGTKRAKMFYPNAAALCAKRACVCVDQSAGNR